MDPISQQPHQEPALPTQQPVEQTMQREVLEEHGSNKWLWIFLAFLLMLGTGFGGYYLGAKQVVPFITTSTPTAAPSAAPATAPIGSSQQKYSYTLKNYVLDDPKDWNVHREVQSFNGVISGGKQTLSPIDHPDYVITILQGGGDGGACNYPDNKVTEGPQQGDYTDYVQLKDQNGTLYRRGLDGENLQKTGLKYTVCQFNQGSYTDLMSFGWIFYNTPHNPDKQILSAMDGVVSSIKVQ